MEVSVNAKCVICLESCTDSGDHQLASLRCGHVFGKSCLEIWFSQSGRRRCPHCNQHASPGDIRKLFLSLDTTEQVKAISKIKSLEENNKKLQLELEASCKRHEEDKTKLDEAISRANFLDERVRQLETMTDAVKILSKMYLLALRIALWIAPVISLEPAELLVHLYDALLEFRK